MYYQQELLEEIRTQNDIVDVVSQYLSLKQKGSSYFGLCPFHNEGTPSFSVASDKQFYYCFGCGAAGNVYSFVMQMEGLDFVEAVKHLADRVHITLPDTLLDTKEAQEADALKKTLLEIHVLAGRFYYEKLQSEVGKKALTYLNDRQILPNIQKKFGIGYAPSGRDMLYQHLKEKGFSTQTILKSGLVLENKDAEGYHDRFFNRLMFPIFDVMGKVIGFGGRILVKGEPKYLNSPETILFSKSRNLYGLNFAKAAKKQEIIIVEGYMDMISVYQAGYHNVAASLGTAFNQDHVKVLKKFACDVILLFDSDEAGTKAALRAIPVLISGGIRVKVAQVPDGKDPDGYIKINGPRALGKLLLNAKSYPSFQIDLIRKEYPRLDTESKISFTTKAAQVIAAIPNKIEQDVYVKDLSVQSGISVEAIQAEIDKILKKTEDAFYKDSLNNQRKVYSEKMNGGQKKSKGLLDAQRDLLYVYATDQEIYEKLNNILNPDSFLEPVYRRLFEIITGFRDRKQAVFPGEMINFFESLDDQKMAAAVFAAPTSYENRKDTEKAVNEGLRIIKTARIDELANTATDIESVMKLIEERKKLDETIISLAE